MTDKQSRIKAALEALNNIDRNDDGYVFPDSAIGFVDYYGDTIRECLEERLEWFKPGVVTVVEDYVSPREQKLLDALMEIDSCTDSREFPSKRAAEAIREHEGKND